MYRNRLFHLHSSSINSTFCHFYPVYYFFVLFPNRLDFSAVQPCHILPLFGICSLIKPEKTSLRLSHCRFQLVRINLYTFFIPFLVSFHCQYCQSGDKQSSFFTWLHSIDDTDTRTLRKNYENFLDLLWQLLIFFTWTVFDQLTNTWYFTHCQHKQLVGKI